MIFLSYLVMHHVQLAELCGTPLKAATFWGIRLLHQLVVIYH